MKFNVNDNVRIKLTQRGRQHLKEQDLLWKLTPGYSTEEKSGGWCEWQLWDVMATFGDIMYNGCAVPFETEIEIMEKKNG